MQIAGSKQLTDYQYMKQKEMWDTTNYEAQKEHLKKAGLNPGLLYGMSGGGGVTTGSGSGTVTGSAADAASTQNAQTAEVGMGMQLASQLALQKAQKENIRS